MSLCWLFSHSKCLYVLRTYLWLNLYISSCSIQRERISFSKAYELFFIFTPRTITITIIKPSLYRYTRVLSTTRTFANACNKRPDHRLGTDTDPGYATQAPPPVPQTEHMLLVLLHRFRPLFSRSQNLLLLSLEHCHNLILPSIR